MQEKFEINNFLERFSRSQSHILQHKTNQNSAEKMVNFETKKTANFQEKGKEKDNENSKEGLITAISSSKKLILPKINIVNRNRMNLNKKETIEDILKKFSSGAPPEISINNDVINKKFDFLFNKKIPVKNERNKLKKIGPKIFLSSVDVIKRRNREIRRKKEKQEQELFEKRQREAKKLMESFKVELDGNNKMRRKVGKRYTIFKEILLYLESNNITLDQMLNNDPFQHEAYMIPNSYEFFTAVKFRNYKYVMNTLNTNAKYLFSVDYLGQTPYHWAAKLGDVKMLQILIDNGPYLNQKDYKGRTPLYLAAMNNHQAACNLLLTKGANIFLKDKKGLGPNDVAGSPEMKSFLMDFMSQPFSNPIYKQKVQQFLLDREERIRLKNEKLEKEKRMKENEKIIKNNGNNNNIANNNVNNQTNNLNNNEEKKN